MARMNELFPSKYLSAGDLENKPHTVTITGGEFVRMKGQDGGPDENKWIAYVAEFDKGWMLNKTNGGVISDIHGDDTDDWCDQQVVIYPTTTTFGNQTVACIRVDPKATKDLLRKKLKQSASPAPAPATSRRTATPITQADVDAADSDEGDGIPF